MKHTDRRKSAEIPKIAVVGSCVTDQITYAARIPKAGETVEGEDYAEGFGGKGANQAAAAAECGANVFMVSCVGSDTRGKETIANFKKRGIDVSHVASVDGAVTGVAPIWVSTETGQNSIIVVPGANKHITPQMVDNAADMLTSMHSVIMQREIPSNTIYHVLEMARKNNRGDHHHITTILNVAPPPKSGEPIDFSKLNGLDYLVVNETEAAALLGRAKVEVQDAKDSAKELLSKAQIANVIVTLGKDGLVLAERGKNPISLRAFDMQKGERKIVDTTGAGDAFIGSFATFLAQGSSKENALKLASLYAGLSATKKGTQSSYPAFAEFRKECEAQGLNLAAMTRPVTRRP